MPTNYHTLDFLHYQHHRHLAIRQIFFLHSKHFLDMSDI